MHPADPGTHLSQGRQERLHLLRIPHDHRKRYRANFLYSAGSSWFRAPSGPPAPHGRPPGLPHRLWEIVLERSLIQNGGSRRTTARSIAALSIGGMIVARTMVGRALADELRTAYMSVALDLGGWSRPARSKNGKSAPAKRVRAARHSRKGVTSY